MKKIEGWCLGTIDLIFEDLPSVGQLSAVSSADLNTAECYTYSIIYSIYSYL